MNSRIRFYLPLSLLLSTAIYAMDNETEKKDAKKLDLPTQTNTIVITPEQSTVISTSNKTKIADVSTSSEDELQAQKLGMWDGLTKWHNTVPVHVQKKITSGTYNHSNSSERNQLIESFSEIADNSSAYVKSKKPSTHQRLVLAQEILDHCRTKGHKDERTVELKKLRKFTQDARTNEEKQLVSEVTEILQNTEKKRTNILEELEKQFNATIEKLDTLDKETSDQLGNRYKQHENVIIDATTVKRLTRIMNPNLPDDGYDSENESKYDREFIARKLGLEYPALNTRKVNKRTVENLATLKTVIKHAANQTLKAHSE